MAFVVRVFSETELIVSETRPLSPGVNRSYTLELSYSPRVGKGEQ